MNIYQTRPIKILDQIFESTLRNSLNNVDFKHMKDILCVSDYSGDRKKDNYFVNSILLTDLKEGAKHIQRINKIRLNEPYLNDKSFFQFKKIWKDDVRLRLLPRFLEDCDKINGVLLVFLIDKNCKWLCSFENKKIASRIEDLGFGKWAPHVLRKSIETFILIAFLASKIPGVHEKFIWLSDRDSRFGDNDQQKDNSDKLLEKMFNLFNLEFKAISKYLQFKQRPDEDLNSITDLSCGFLLDVLDHPEKSRSTSIEYLKWFSKKDGSLNKVAISIKCEKDRIRAIEMKYK